MEKLRKIHRVSKSQATIEGAGVHLKRAFGFREPKAYDPFLLLDDFRSNDAAHYLPGFPWHPHRGIETITYILDGTVAHGDSMGNEGVIGAGDVQWMTAGSGIIHQEMPSGDEHGRMGGFQLWANLPAVNKMMDPRYQDVKSVQIPIFNGENGVKIRVICGELNGVRGPVEDIIAEPRYLDVSIPAGLEFTLPTKIGHTVFAYVIDGNCRFCREKNPFNYEVEGENYFDIQSDPNIFNESLVLFEDGDHVVVTTVAEPVRFLLISGKPLREPVAWYGPIVMNNRAELEVAFDEYRQGTFIKKGK